MLAQHDPTLATNRRECRPRSREYKAKVGDSLRRDLSAVGSFGSGIHRHLPVEETGAAADARVRAFFARMVRPGGPLPPGASE
jgi:hypothetical protein